MSSMLKVFQSRELLGPTGGAGDSVDSGQGVLVGPGTPAAVGTALAPIEIVSLQFADALRFFIDSDQPGTLSILQAVDPVPLNAVVSPVAPPINQVDIVTLAFVPGAGPLLVDAANPAVNISAPYVRAIFQNTGVGAQTFFDVWVVAIFG